MAQLGLSGVTPALNLVLMDEIAKQYRRDSVLLNILRSKRDRNSALTFAIKTDSNSAGAAYAPGADMSSGEYSSEGRVQATFGWANYRIGINVADETLDIVAASGGAEGVDLLTVEVMDATAKLSQVVGAALYTGDPTATSPYELAGAAAMIDTSGIVGGIDRSSNTYWRGNEDTVATADFSISSLRTKLFRPVKNSTGRDPDFVTAPGAMIDLLKDRLEDKADTVSQVSIRGDLIDLTKAAGSRAVIVDGVPFIEDRHATASTFYAWSQDYIDLRYIPPAPATDTPADLARYVSSITGLRVSDNDIAARLKAQASEMRPILAHVGKTGTSEKLIVRTGNIQVAWLRPNAFSKLAIT